MSWIVQLFIITGSRMTISSGVLEKLRKLLVSNCLVFCQTLDWNIAVKKIFFSVKTILQLAFVVLHFLFFKEFQLKQQKSYNNIKCIFYFGCFPAGFFFQGFFLTLFPGVVFLEEFSWEQRVKPLNSGHLRVLKNLSVIGRCPLLGGNFKKIITFGTQHFVLYSWPVRYLGCLLLGGFTVQAFSFTQCSFCLFSLLFFVRSSFSWGQLFFLFFWGAEGVGSWG